MTLSAKTAFTYFFVGFCSLGLIVMVYITRIGQVSMTSLVPMDKRLAHLHESNQDLIFKKDLPVLYLTDVAVRDREKLQENVTSRRTAPFGGMLPNKIKDDYRFCRKVAPFVGPYDYISNAKSPCWYSGDDKFWCVPYFYLAGFSKSGTTDLFNRIAAHPDILGTEKEKHWLDYYRYFDKEDSVESYASKFSRVSEVIKKHTLTKGNSHIVIGEGTPCYAWDSLYWPCYEGNKGLTEPKYTNADVIYRLNPRAKIIMVLRDPVTRLYSRYLTWKNRLKYPAFMNPSPYQFHKLSTKATKLYTTCFKEWSHRHCAYNGTLYAQSMSRLQEGMYSIYIRDWLKVFPRNQIFIIKFEDYVTNVPEYLHRIYSFLNVTRLEDPLVQQISKLKAKNVGSNYDTGPMMDETKDMLQQFYAPFNRDLQYVLDDTSWEWGYE